MRKICIIVASRANYSRLKSVINAIIEHPALELQLIAAASALETPIDWPVEPIRVQCLASGDNLQTMTLTTGLFLVQLGGVLERLQPDMVLVHADRHEMLSAAIAASYLNLPLFHTEGGERTGSIDDKVRDAITKLADWHFPVTEMAREQIISMGEHPETVFTVGSPALDLLKSVPNSDSPRKEPYVVVLQHPNTTHPEDIMPLIEAVNNMPIHKVWINPNVDPGSKKMLKIIHRQDVEFAKNLPPEEFARFMYHSKCLIGNTSAGIKEGAFLGVPYVCIGRRQESREHGDNVVFVDNERWNIFGGTLEQINHGSYRPDHRFGDGTSGEQIADILSWVKTR